MTVLTKNQTERLKQFMKRRHTALLTGIRGALSRTGGYRNGDLAGLFPDIGDEDVRDLLINVDNVMVGRDIQEVRDIEAALKRMDHGTYGDCIDCGHEIGYDRLLIFPTAKRCFPCQGVHAKAHVHRATATL